MAVQKEAIELKNILFVEYQKFMIAEGVDVDKAEKLAKEDLRKLKGI